MEDYGKLYNNDIVVNNGLTLDGNTPLDDRLVWEGFESIYVSESDPTLCPLFNKAYNGMIIILFDMVNGEKKSYLMFLKDASPYIPGMGGSVTSENYLDYWRQDSVDYAQILKFVSGHNTKPGDKVVGYFGDVTGMTAAQLDELDTKEVISRILFELCVPSRVSSPGLAIKYNSASSYRVPVEVGSAMPKSTEFGNIFTQDVWKWVSSHNPETTGSDQYLCDNNGAVTFYLNNGDGDVILDNVPASIVVKEGTSGNGSIFAKKPYVSTGYAKDSRGSERNPNTGEYYHKGASGTATSNVLTVTGGWKAYANAPKKYNSLTEAWNMRNTEPGSMPDPVDTRKVASSFVMTENSHKLYVQWPSATTDDVKFYVWVPASYQITGAKSANNLTPAYDIELGYTYDKTVSVKNDKDATGDYKLYYIGKAPGITNAEITMSKA